MHRSAFFPTLALAIPAVLVLSGCGELRTPTDATPATTPSIALSTAQGPETIGGIVAHDACDPETFNASPFGPDLCFKQGRVTFDDFVAILTAQQSVPEWHFTSDHPTARLGVDILGVNVGGEVHTFTPVKQFGGGLIQILNDLSGNPVITPECSAIEDDDKVAPGGKYQIEAEELAASVDADGIARVQCCIHPWMRSEIHMVHSSN